MANAIGYRSADMVYKIERDATEPSWEQADKWARACGKLIGDILPNSGGSRLDDTFQPLLAALVGYAEREIAEQVLILASQVRLNRNAILRRREPDHTTNSSVLPYHPPPTNHRTDELRVPVGEQGLSAETTHASTRDRTRAAAKAQKRR